MRCVPGRTGGRGPWLPGALLVLVGLRATALAEAPEGLAEADRAAIASLKTGTAAGDFTVDGRGARLTFAYAVARRTFPGDPEKLVLVLTDTAVPDATLLASFGLQRLAAEGRLHAVEIELDAERRAAGGDLHHPAFAAGPGGFGPSVSVSGMHRFLPAAVDASAVAGKLFMDGPADFMGARFHYSAVFRAAVVRRPAPTHEGAAAARSGPGKVVAAFLDAGRTGNKAGLFKLMDPAMRAELEGPDGAEMLSTMKETFAPGLKVVEVTETGEAAEVVAFKRGRSGGESMKFRAVRIDGRWKIGVRTGP